MNTKHVKIQVIFILVCLLLITLLLYASDQANVKAEFNTSTKGADIYRLHNYEYRIVECYIYGDHEYFNSFTIGKRQASGWMFTPDGIVWECY